MLPMNGEGNKKMMGKWKPFFLAGSNLVLVGSREGATTAVTVLSFLHLMANLPPPQVAEKLPPLEMIVVT